MSKIAGIMTALRTEIATLLPTHRELDFPTIPEENDNLMLARGQGIASQIGSNTNRLTGCKLSIARDILVTLTRQTCAINTDRDQSFQNEIDLLEDAFIVIKEYEKNVTIDGLVAKINFVSDTGVLPIFIDESQFNMIQLTFNIEYLEDLT